MAEVALLCGKGLKAEWKRGAYAGDAPLLTLSMNCCRSPSDGPPTTRSTHEAVHVRKRMRRQVASSWSELEGGSLGGLRCNYG
jgi:hypothetical protein